MSDVTLPPNHPDRNKHHDGTYHSQEEFEQDLLGMGKGDPAHYPDPAEEKYRAGQPLPVTNKEERMIKILVETQNREPFGIGLETGIKTDGMIVCYNVGGGWIPYQFLLPGQLYEKDINKKLEELGRKAEIVVFPVTSNTFVKVAES